MVDNHFDVVGFKLYFQMNVQVNIFILWAVMHNEWVGL